MLMGLLYISCLYLQFIEHHAWKQAHYSLLVVGLRYNQSGIIAISRLHKKVGNMANIRTHYDVKNVVGESCDLHYNLWHETEGY